MNSEEGSGRRHPILDMLGLGPEWVEVKHLSKKCPLCGNEPIEVTIDCPASPCYIEFTDDGYLAIHTDWDTSQLKEDIRRSHKLAGIDLGERIEGGHDCIRGRHEYWTWRKLR